MPKSADESAQLEESSDVIELTEEVEANSSEARSREDVDALALQMPEFRVPQDDEQPQTAAVDDPTRETIELDRESQDGADGGAAVDDRSPDVPAAAIISKRGRINKRADGSADEATGHDGPAESADASDHGEGAALHEEAALADDALGDEARAGEFDDMADTQIISSVDRSGGAGMETSEPLELTEEIGAVDRDEVETADAQPGHAEPSTSDTVDDEPIELDDEVVELQEPAVEPPSDGDEEVEYDRQELVKTIQMQAIDRSAFERKAELVDLDETVLLTSHRHAPAVLIAPPRVLTTRWKEGSPIEVASPAAKPAKEIPAVQADEQEPPATATTLETGPPEPQDAGEAGEDGVGAEDAEDAEDADDVAATADGQGVSAVEEIDEVEELEEIEPVDEGEALPEDEVLSDIEPEPLELDSEAIEEHLVDQPKPPPKPAVKPQEAPAEPPAAAKPPPAATPAAKPPAAEAEAEAEASPAPTAPDDEEDDAELNGLVQELLEENKKPARPAKPRRPGRDNWFQTVFNEEYLRTLPPNIHRQTRREVDFIEQSLAVGDDQRILDLACGFGRHSIELTRRGYEVIGLDLSMPLLQKALNEAKRQSLSIKFIHGDMRAMNFDEIFGGAFLWQTSFGFFDERENVRVLHNLNRALQMGGRVVIDVINRDHIIDDMPHRIWWEGIECVFLEEVEFDAMTSVLHTKRSYIYEDGTPPLEQNSFIRLYSLHELRQLLNATGFKVAQASGELHHRGVYMGAASSRIIVTAEKVRRLPRAKQQAAKKPKQ